MKIILKFLFCGTFAAQTICAQELLVKPYVQAGNFSTLAKEGKVLIWQTDSIPAVFSVEASLQHPTNPKKVIKAKATSVELNLRGKTTHLYRAELKGLQFDTTYFYKVMMNGKVIADDTFRTRTKKAATQFVVLGDFGSGSQEQATIASLIARHKPQFIVTTGDNVYENGLEEEYRRNLFPIYLSPQADRGASMMSKIPFYMVLGNHDVRSDSLDKNPGSFAYFYYSDLPLNAPLTERAATIRGSSDLVKAFKKNTKPRFPRISNYSFQYGNVHMVCLDANDYINPLDPQLVNWLRNDLGQSTSEWKIVTFHHPGFNSSIAHYEYQLMRLLSPLFEQLGVNLVVTGHVHNYQRSVPLLFAPKTNQAGDQYLISPEGKIDGTFTLDTQFDGVDNTKPKGIIYIVTGAGGAPLYDKRLNENPALWKHEPPENWAPFTKELISDRHSFTLIKTLGKVLTLQQIDINGEVIDEIKVTK
ncbi:MAG TPA: metallophosphoesterase family protein [Chryseolinea sp.]